MKADPNPGYIDIYIYTLYSLQALYDNCECIYIYISDIADETKYVYIYIYIYTYMHVTCNMCCVSLNFASFNQLCDHTHCSSFF